MKKILIICLSMIVGAACLFSASCAGNGESPSDSSEQTWQSVDDGSQATSSGQSGQSSQKTSRTPVQPISDGGGFQGGEYLK